MLQVLEPFEERAGDTTTVNEKISGTHDSALGEEFLSCVRGGAVSTFKDSFNLNLAGVLFVKRLLNGSRDKEISLLLHKEVGVLKLRLGSTGESAESALLGHPVLDSLNIRTSGLWIAEVYSITVVTLPPFFSRNFPAQYPTAPKA
jgi:hypothetical protein